MSEADFSAPVRLAEFHDRTRFDCGTDSLNVWLLSRAMPNERSGVSRTYVTCVGTTVVGYYCLLSTEILRDDAPRSVRRNAPNLIPATLLGRLAVDVRYQGHGMGKALVRDAILRTVRAGEIVGSALLVVDALSEDLITFYAELGFLESATDPLRRYLPLASLRSNP